MRRAQRDLVRAPIVGRLKVISAEHADHEIQRMVRTEGGRQLSAAVESGSRKLVIGDVGGPCIQRFVNHFVIRSEFLLQDARPAAVRREPYAGRIGVGRRGKVRTRRAGRTLGRVRGSELIFPLWFVMAAV